MEKRMVKRLAAAMLAATVAIGTPMAASATWRTEGKGWNWTVDGKNATGWQMIENTWYYFNSEGTMQTGWVPYGNSWYFLQPSGAMATGWVQDNGKWYYTKADGAMATGWVQAGDTWYCMSSTGEMRTGWVASGDDWYYLAPTGAMVTDAVIKVDDAVYAIAADGSMQTGEVEIAGETYTFGDDGAATGETIPEPTRAFETASTPGGGVVETKPTPSETKPEKPVDTKPEKPSTPSTPSTSTPDDDDDDDSGNGGSGNGGSGVTQTTKVEAFSADTALLGKKPSDMGSITVSGTTVTGTVKWLTGYTGWDSTAPDGYFIPLIITPKEVTDDMTITVKGDNPRTFKKADLETADTLGGAYAGKLVLVFKAGNTEAGALKTKLTIEIDYDGAGDKTAETKEINLDLKKAAPEASFAAFGTSDKPLDELGDTKTTNDVCTLTVPTSATDGVVSVTGTMKKVDNWEKWSGDTDLNSGYFVAVKITPLAIGDNKGTVKYPSLGKEDSNPTPAILVYRLADKDGNFGAADKLKVPITISYGSDYEEKTYTLDFSAVTRDDAGTPSGGTPASNPVE